MKYGVHASVDGVQQCSYLVEIGKRRRILLAHFYNDVEKEPKLLGCLKLEFVHSVNSATMYNIKTMPDE
jgi:hypothetical protein